MSVLGIFKGHGKRGFGYNSSAGEVTEGLDLGGRTILVTGCGSGLGQETMRTLCARGAPSRMRSLRTRVGACRRDQRAAVGLPARGHHRQRRHHGPADVAAKIRDRASLAPLLFKSVSQGAATPCYVAVHPGS